MPRTSSNNIVIVLPPCLNLLHELVQAECRLVAAALLVVIWVLALPVQIGFDGWWGDLDYLDGALCLLELGSQVDGEEMDPCFCAVVDWVGGVSCLVVT